MATVHHDAELMTTYRAAVVKPASEFVSFRDGPDSIGVLSRADDGEVFIVTTSPAGQRVSHEAHKFFGLSGRVAAFTAVTTDDGVSFLLASETGTGRHDLTLFCQLSHEEISAPPATKVYKCTAPPVKNVYLSDTLDDDGFPTAVCTPYRWDKFEEVDIKPLTVHNGALKYHDDWDFTANVVKVLDIAVGYTPMGAGVWVLYKSHEEEKVYLQFKNNVVRGDDRFEVVFPVHNSSTSLSTYIDPKGYSALLLGGSELSLYTRSEYLYHDATASARVQLPRGITTMHVAQKEDSIIVWYADSLQAGYYYSTSRDTFDKGELIQFLPDNSGRAMHGLLWDLPAQGTVVRTLTTLNDEGYLTLWHQGVSAGFWEQFPFHVDASDSYTPISAYAIRFQVEYPAKPHAISQCQVHLVSTGVVRVYSNGKPIFIGPKGTWHETDARGVLNITIPTQDITCHTIHITSLKPKGSNDEISVVAEPFDPSAKVSANLARIKTVNDLLTARVQTESGEPGRLVVAPGTLTGDRAATLADGIAKCMQAHNEVACQKSSSGLSAATYRPPVSKDWSLFSLWDKLMDLVNKGAKLLKAELKRLEDDVPGPWKLIVHYLEEPFEFVIDSIVTAMKAANFLIKLLEAEWEILKGWLGFVFHWPEIKTCARGITAWVNSSLDWAEDKVEDLTQAVQKYTSELASVLDGDQNVANSAPSYSLNGAPGSSDPKVKGLQNSVQHNWALDILLDPGHVTGFSLMKIQGASAEEEDVITSDPGFQRVFEYLQEAFADLKTMLMKTFGNITEWFSTDMSTGEFLARLGRDILAGIVRIAGDVVSAVVELFEAILQAIRKLINLEIVIPVLTPLFNKITGQKLSILGVLSIVLAIPMTVVCRAVTGKAPPDVSGLTKDFWNQYTSSGSDGGHSSRVMAVAGIGDMAAFADNVILISTDAGRTTAAVRTAVDGLKALTLVDVGGFNLFDIILAIFKLISAGAAYPWPGHFPRDTVYHYLSFGANALKVGTIVICIQARYFTKMDLTLNHLCMNVPIAICSVADTVFKAIIYVHDVEAKDNPQVVFQIIETTLALAGDILNVVGTGCAVAEQEEVSAVCAALALGCTVIGGITSIAELSDKYHLGREYQLSGGKEIEVNEEKGALLLQQD
ncbi:hypothetical protein CFD26_102955 [Aspergillus turcosus]|uniref:Uncharacterized protein n=1 Tax=Aspergillus turcosus TaxID=1245748 RepID=A0A421D632_9EURO|nr:hypothetical protein CFD26_102955 [Aspergillus turcosus]